jgi:hypothetical protein
MSFWSALGLGSSYEQDPAQLGTTTYQNEINTAITDPARLQTQNALYSAIQNQLSGSAPSVAQQQLQQALQQNQNQVASNMASTRGINPALAQELAMRQGGQMAQQAAGQGALLRAQEFNQGVGNAIQQGQLANNQLATLGQMQQGQQSLNLQNSLGTGQINAGTAATNAGIASNIMGGLIGAGGSIGAAAAGAAAEGGEADELPPWTPPPPMPDIRVGSSVPLTGGQSLNDWAKVAKKVGSLAAMMSEGGRVFPQLFDAGGWALPPMPDIHMPAVQLTGGQAISAGVKAGRQAGKDKNSNSGFAKDTSNFLNSGSSSSAPMLSGNDTSDFLNSGSQYAKGGKIMEPHIHRIATIYHPDKFSIQAMAARGGKVPGTPKVARNDPKNDVVPAMLTPKEIVLPLSVTQSSNAPEAAKQFVARILGKDKTPPKKEMSDFKIALNRAISSRKVRP